MAKCSHVNNDLRIKSKLRIHNGILTENVLFDLNYTYDSGQQ